MWNSFAPKGSAGLETLIKEIFAPRILLDLVRNFVVFEVDSGKTIKRIAAYHQYHAVNTAVECTVQAASPKGNKRASIIWHTQNSGKSLSVSRELVQAVKSSTTIDWTVKEGVRAKIRVTVKRILRK